MKKPSAIFAACISALLIASLVVTAAIMVPPPPLSTAQTPAQPDAPGGSDGIQQQRQSSANQTFGCSVFSGAVHCDPLLNAFEGYEVGGSAEKIYAVTRADEDISYVEGAMGQALEFRAYYGEFLNVTNSASLNPAQFSVSFWAKRGADFGNYGHVVSHVNAEGNAGWAFDNANVTSQSIRFGVFGSNGTMFAPGEVELDSDAFVHIVGTFDGSAVKIYRNGELSSAPVQFAGEYVADPGTAIKLAMASPRFSSPWSGTLDEIRVYDRALADFEVRELFSGNSNGGPDSSIGDGLVLHLPLDGSIADSSGNNNTVTLPIQAAGMAVTPDGRLFFTEKNTGKIRVMQNDRILEEPFATVPDLHYNMEQGLLGIAIDPEFEQNRYVYVYYTAFVGNATESSSAPFNRVARFTDVDGAGTDMTVIIDNIAAHRGGMHAGGALAFGPDGKLYVTVGNAYEVLDGQNTDSLLGKTLRINKDGSIPQDNPFPGSPIYTTGHRNAYGIAFDAANNVGIVTENGDDNYDEINPVVKGGDYGYPTTQTPNRPPELAPDDDAEMPSVKPIRSYWKTIAPTQAIFYTGDKHPELAGKFLVGSYNNGRLYALEVDSGGKLAEEMKIEFPIPLSIIGVAQSPSGDVYFGGHYVYKLESVDAQAKRPTVATVELSHPPSMDVRSMSFSPADKSLAIDFTSAQNATGNATTPSTPSAAFEVRISKVLMDGITAVHVGGQPADFMLEDANGYNTIILGQVPTGGASLEVSIMASSVPAVGSDSFPPLLPSAEAPGGP